MSANRYPVRTLLQMTEIPEEAMPRFLAELPSILKTYRQMLAAADELAAEARAKAPWFLRWAITGATFRASLERAGGEWIDDDKGLATVGMRTVDGKPAFYSRTEKMDRPA